GVDTAAHAAREVYAEERKARIGYRVDQSLDQAFALGGEVVVLAAEGNDAHLGRLASQTAYVVAVQPGAIDHIASGEGAASGFNRNGVGAASEAGHLGVQADGSALRGDDFRVLAAHGGVIGNASAGYNQGAHAGAVRFVLAHLLGTDHAQALQTIRSAAAVQLVQAREFVLGSSADKLAANLVRNVVLPAECDHCCGAFYAGTRLDGAGLVIDAGVDHAAVV